MESIPGIIHLKTKHECCTDMMSVLRDEFTPHLVRALCQLSASLVMKVVPSDVTQYIQRDILTQPILFSV